MAAQEFRDQNLRLIGWVKTRSDGRLEARDVTGTIKGTYDPRTNETRDSVGRLVGRGNWLAKFFRC